MVDVLLVPPASVETAGSPDAADVERGARRTLRRQIARLDAEIGEAVLASFSRRGHGEGSRPHRPPVVGGPGRLLDLGELELVRDELAARLHTVRAENDALAARQLRKRAELERMLLEPGRHRFTEISRADIGEAGCGVYRVRPRLGLVGMLAGWWQVKVSSGCPLPGR